MNLFAPSSPTSRYEFCATTLDGPVLGGAESSAEPSMVGSATAAGFASTIAAVSVAPATGAANGLYPPDASAVAICCIWCGLNPAAAAAAAAVDADAAEDAPCCAAPFAAGVAWYCCIAAIAGPITLSIAAQLGPFAPAVASGALKPGPGAAAAGAPRTAALSAAVAVSAGADAGAALAVGASPSAELCVESCLCRCEGSEENAEAVGLCSPLAVGDPGAGELACGKKGLNPPRAAANVCAAAYAAAACCCCCTRPPSADAAAAAAACCACACACAICAICAKAMSEALPIPGHGDAAPCRI